MNKKLLFATLSLAALAACTSDDLEVQNVAEGTSPVKFEVINDVSESRASMNGNKIAWDGLVAHDKFTLYHGCTTPGYLTGYENATYTANATDGATATLSTPSMIKTGAALMVWPVDSTFRITSSDRLSVVIPEVLTDVAKHIPYVSDLVYIGVYNNKAPYNTAGLNRSYPVYMRPMASQLTVKADYMGTDAKIEELYEGGSACTEVGEGIDPIKVEAIDIITDPLGSTLFTKRIPLDFNSVPAAKRTYWDTKVPNNAWSKITVFDLTSVGTAGQTDKLTAKEKALVGNTGCKLLLLPQNPIALATGVDGAEVVVNTIYGKVVVGNTANSKYTATEAKDAWYRYIAKTSTPKTGETKATAATASDDASINGKYKTTANVAQGMAGTINDLSTATSSDAMVEGQPIGAAATRYVKTLLTHLDMSDLHVKSDKQLRDAARVWKHMGLDDVTVYLDGSTFKMSQKTIEVINKINGNYSGKTFKVKPCVKAGEACATIQITGANYKNTVQDLRFVTKNGTTGVNVELANETTPWVWQGEWLLPTAINKVTNKGILENAANTTISAVTVHTATPSRNVSVYLVNDNTWNVNAGTLRAQISVVNNGVLNIAKGAQYRQDSYNQAADLKVFTNEATAKPKRFGGNDKLIGKVNNNGVFATIGDGEINNYGLIEHLDVDAKTFITRNQTKTDALVPEMTGTYYNNDADFAKAFLNNKANSNKMGTINLPYSNKDEDNISISAAASQGFVMVTVDNVEDIVLSTKGQHVNYLNVMGVAKNVKLGVVIDYLEINANQEVVWQPGSSLYKVKGLMVLSDINIKLSTNVVSEVTYLGADMYVGGVFNKNAVTISGAPYSATNWNGYFGNTSGSVPTKYITF